MTSRDSLLSPYKFPSDMGSGLFIPSMNPTDSVSQLYTKTRNVVFVDIHTYIKRLDSRNKDLERGDYTTFFNKVSPYVFDNSNSL